MPLFLTVAGLVSAGGLYVGLRSHTPEQPEKEGTVQSTVPLQAVWRPTEIQQTGENPPQKSDTVALPAAKTQETRQVGGVGADAIEEKQIPIRATVSSPQPVSKPVPAPAAVEKMVPVAIGGEKPARHEVSPRDEDNAVAPAVPDGAGALSVLSPPIDVPPKKRPSDKGLTFYADLPNKQLILPEEMKENMAVPSPRVQGVPPASGLQEGPEGPEGPEGGPEGPAGGPEGQKASVIVPQPSWRAARHSSRSLAELEQERFAEPPRQPSVVGQRDRDTRSWQTRRDPPSHRVEHAQGGDVSSLGRHALPELDHTFRVESLPRGRPVEPTSQRHDDAVRQEAYGWSSRRNDASLSWQVDDRRSAHPDFRPDAHQGGAVRAVPPLQQDLQLLRSPRQDPEARSDPYAWSVSAQRTAPAKPQRDGYVERPWRGDDAVSLPQDSQYRRTYALPHTSQRGGYPTTTPGAQPPHEPAPARSDKNWTRTPAPAEPATEKRDGYLVQVAVLSDAQKAMALADRLRQQGVTPQVKTVKRSSGHLLYQIRLGPFATYAEAAKALKTQRLKGHPPAIVRTRR